MYLAVEPAWSILLMMAVAAVIWWRRSLGNALTVGATVALTWLPVGALKYIEVRPHPDDVTALPHPFHPVQHDGSFPSGQVAFAVVVVVSILIDAMHFPTDVAASVVWALCAGPVIWALARHVLARVAPLESMRTRQVPVRA